MPGRPAPELAAEAVCPQCEGRGWIVAVDGGAGTARPCPCREAGRATRLIAAAGIPPKYLGCTLDNFNTQRPGDRGARDQLVQARQRAVDYVENFARPEGGFRESGLLFIGRPGVGKTHLAVAVLADLVRTYRRRGRFVDFTTLIHQIQSTFDPSSPESKHEVLDPVMGADVLVLDELGAQKPTPWVQDILYLVINTRYTRRLPTLFTTNYRLDDAAEPAPAKEGEYEEFGRPLGKGSLPPLRDRISSVLISRLFEMTQPVVLAAVDDYRSWTRGPKRRRLSPA
jgi:DNA replication protein DnaC